MICYANEETQAQKSTVISAQILTTVEQMTILRLKKVPGLIKSRNYTQLTQKASYT